MIVFTKELFTAVIIPASLILGLVFIFIYAGKIFSEVFSDHRD